MKNKYIDYLNNLKTDDVIYNELIDERIKDIEKYDDKYLVLSKHLRYDTIFKEFSVDAKLFDGSRDAYHLKQKDDGVKKNIYIKYNGTPIALESHVKGIEILEINEGMKKYPFLVKEHLKKRVDNKNIDKKDILTRSLFSSGVFIYIHDNALINHVEGNKIYLYSSIGEGEIVDFGYNLIIIGKNNNVEIVDEKMPVPFEGEALSSTYQDIFVGENSVCKYISVSTFGQNVNQLEAKDLFLDEHAQVEYVDLLLDGKTITQKVNAFMVGSDGNFNLHGVAFASGNEIYETYSIINNRVKGTQGRIVYKNIVDKNSKNFFDGLIKIEKGADFTNSYLEDHTILLSPDARSESIPGLEIEADEVKASHGATIGNLDKDQMFYAQSRGLTDIESRKIIISGFVRPIIDLLQDSALEERVFDYFSHKLNNE